MARKAKSTRILAATTIDAVAKLEGLWEDFGKARKAVRPPGAKTAKEFGEQFGIVDATHTLQRMEKNGQVTGTYIYIDGRKTKVYTPIVK